MEKTAEIFAVTNLERNIEEWITLDVRGQSHSIYQKANFGGESRWLVTKPKVLPK